MIWELRHEYKLELLLRAAQLPRATYYYHVKRMKSENKYAEVEEQITNIFHEIVEGMDTAGSPWNCTIEDTVSIIKRYGGS